MLPNLLRYIRFPGLCNFGFWNTTFGWLLFVNALITYLITLEPTVSFWDSGEYIATSAKLEVAHPPGAPFFQMVGAFFALFALNQEQIARAVNFVSVVSSAFTILFLFFTITNLSRKILAKVEKKDTIVILGSGLIGALSFTYSDSFWFNATETEVYAMASFVMALLLWLGLKYVDSIGKARADKWLLLICFVVGLTFGIQFMGFLAIPSMVLLNFFKRNKKVTFKNFALANIVSIGLLFFVFKFSLTYVLQLFAWGELFFVNEIGLPFNSGSLITGLLLFGLCYYLLWLTRIKGLVQVNTVLLCFLFLVLGFSTWLVLPIRANAHVAINENDPSDARTLLAYYNREQYPSVDSPFYGTYYSNAFAERGETVDDKPKYEKDLELGKYVIINNYKDAISGPNKDHVGFLPRLWSEEHAENYMRYFGRLDFKIKSAYYADRKLHEAIREFKELDASGVISTEQYINFLNSFNDYIDVAPPDIGQNLKFLFEYQLGYMYLRYFMWNFVGRQNDVQWRYDANGHWLSGIGFLDGLRLGSQKNLPKEVEENKARNTYFFLPFILGLIGFFFQLFKDPKHFWVLFVFFVFTGLAIQFYTNPYIFQPRERDYSLVGSFYAFSIWMGMGFLGLCRFFKKKLHQTFAMLVFVCCCCGVPLLMAFQNWDDHDRSHRYTARASAKAYLDSTQQDAGAILFTIGDNDNFPLWYLQEIEGYRTDVRVIVTSYFATDWYIDQMKRQSYESKPIPSQLSHDKYSYGTRDAIYYQALPIVKENRWLIKDFMNWVENENPKTKLKYIFERTGRNTTDYPSSTLEMTYYPTNKIRIPVNKENVLKSGLVKAKDAHLILDHIDIDLPNNFITKNRLMMLDIVANNDWERPIYFSGGSFDDAEYIWMKDYLQLDGLAYKLVPIRTENTDGYTMGRVDTELMYKNVKKWDWGNSGNEDIYQDPQTRKQFGVTIRLNLARLAEELIKENKQNQAREILDLAMENVPLGLYGFYAFVEPFLDGYYAIGDRDKASDLFGSLSKIYRDRLEYHALSPIDQQQLQLESILSNLQGYRRVLDILVANENAQLAQKEQEKFNSYVDKFGLFFKD